MSDDNVRVKNLRNNRRILHWIVAGAFFALLATGLIIYTPTFSALAAGSWTRLVHRIAAVTIVSAPIIYTLMNRGAALQWIKEAAIWKRKTTATLYVNSWKKKHKLLISLGFIIVVTTGTIQWFLKEIVPSSVFNVSLLIHDIAFFSAIILLLYHIYFEFYWFQWKRKYCSRCSFAYCADACPVGAMISKQDGTIERVQQKCNNCRLCMENCQRNSYYKIQPKKVTKQMKTESKVQQLDI
jgi:cytochrome b subunit of formate dehydrogenase